MHVVSWGTRESATAVDPNKKPVKKLDSKLQVFDKQTSFIALASSKWLYENSEYDQEIPQSQTADNPVAPRGRAAQPSRDTRKTN